MITLKESFFYTEPFDHIIYQNCIKLESQKIFNELDSIFQENKSLHVENSNYSKIEIKKTKGYCGQLLDFMCGQELLKECQKIFKIEPLYYDTNYDGGGLTFTPPGKFLRYHFDFPYSNIAKKYRVLNALLYLSPPEIQGGDLHLLDLESGTVEASIKPSFGTLVIFPTSNKTAHGVSKIKNCSRVSINSYFYSDKPLDDRTKPSKTTWINNIKGLSH